MKMSKWILEILDEHGYDFDDYDVLMRVRPPWSNPTLEDRIKWMEFERAMGEQDFSVSDSFWLNDIEFTVTKSRIDHR